MNVVYPTALIFPLLLIFGWVLIIQALIGFPKTKRGIFSEEERPSSPQRYILAILYLCFNVILSPVYAELINIIKQFF